MKISVKKQKTNKFLAYTRVVDSICLNRCFLDLKARNCVFLLKILKIPNVYGFEIKIRYSDTHEHLKLISTVQKTALCWQEKPTSLMNENKLKNRQSYSALVLKMEKMRWIIITKTTIGGILNLQNSPLLTFFLP